MLLSRADADAERHVITQSL